MIIESKRRRLAAAMTSPLDDAIKTGIVGMVRFSETGGGSCVPRAVIAQGVLWTCGIQSRLVAGAMLFRAGPHPSRDTLRFALANNQGGIYQGTIVGHVWNEYERDLIDFSSADWQGETALIYSTIHLAGIRTIKG